MRIAQLIPYILQINQYFTETYLRKNSFKSAVPYEETTGICHKTVFLSSLFGLY